MANVFGASAGFGTLVGWQLQSVNDPKSQKRATAFSKTNNETNSQMYDERQDVTATYKAAVNYAATAPTVPANIGAVVNSIILTSIQLSLSASGFATMTLSGHKHTAVGGSDGTTLRSIAHGITLTKGFGAGGLSITPAGMESIQSADCTIECDHEESANENGVTTQGENHNPRITASFNCFGPGPVTAPATYDLLSHAPSRSNEGFNTVTIQCYKALAFSEA